MKKILFFCLMICLLLPLCACGPRKDSSADAYSFDFSYSISPEAPERKKQFSIKAEMINASGRDYTNYTKEELYHPNAELFTIVDGEKHVVEAEIESFLYTTMAPQWMTFASGAGGNHVFYYKLPADAPGGSYHLALSYGGCSQVFENVFTLEPLMAETPLQDRAFAFHYTSDASVPKREEPWQLETSVTNIAETPYIYFGCNHDFTATPTLYTLIDGEKRIIEPQPYALTTDLKAWHTIAVGEKDVFAFTYVLPADAPAGDYYLTLSCGGKEVTYENIFALK